MRCFGLAIEIELQAAAILLPRFLQSLDVFGRGYFKARQSEQHGADGNPGPPGETRVPALRTAHCRGRMSRVERIAWSIASSRSQSEINSVKPIDGSHSRRRAAIISGNQVRCASPDGMLLSRFIELACEE